MPVVHTIVPSPLGDLVLRAEDGALTGLFFPVEDRVPPSARLPDLGAAGDDPVFALARIQLCEYFARERETFDLPLAPVGTPFQLRVWTALRVIPYGITKGYGELARELGDARASRAVGLANGQNPISIVVPCHRVLGADGRLVGFGGGIARKRALLDLERGF